MRPVLVLLLLVGCDEPGPIAKPDAGVMVDAFVEHPDDGFGNACAQNPDDSKPYTECKSMEGVVGICVMDACRRYCRASDRYCPAGQSATDGVDGLCWCEPQNLPPQN
jgi:hypothetical protein